MLVTRMSTITKPSHQHSRVQNCFLKVISYFKHEMRNLDFDKVLSLHTIKTDDSQMESTFYFK